MKYIIVLSMLIFMGCATQSAVIICNQKEEITPCVERVLGEEVKIIKVMRVGEGVYMVEYRE